MKARITKVLKGKLKGQFRFQLVSSNGEVIAQSYPETYTQKHSVMEVLEKYFPLFIPEDVTENTDNKS